MLEINKVRYHCIAAIQELSHALEYAKEEDVIAPHLVLMIERGKLKLYRLKKMLEMLESEDIPNNKKIEKVRGWIHELIISIKRDMQLAGLVQEKIVKEARQKAPKPIVRLSEAEAAELAAL